MLEQPASAYPSPSDHSLPHIALPGYIKAPKQLLQIILWGIINLDKTVTKPTALVDQGSSEQLKTRSHPPELTISLKQIYGFPRIIYSSAIAHQIANQNSAKAAELATHIAQHVTNYTASVYPTPVHLQSLTDWMQGITCQATSTGMIQFKLTDPAIVSWLNTLINPPDSLGSTDQAEPIDVTKFDLAKLDPAKLFPIQHAHARCCSLLRLAHVEHLIRLEPAAPQPGRSMTILEPISWLTPDLQLHPNSPPERQLIGDLMLALDRLAEPTSASRPLVSVAEAVSCSFQTVHQTCQIFGSQVAPGDRLHSHLALILATQRTLSRLLEVLGLTAPIEL